MKKTCCKKRITLTIILALVLVIALSVTIYASNIDTNKSTSILETYLNDVKSSGTSEELNIRVIDADTKDVSSTWKQIIVEYYEKSEFNAIRELLADNNLTLASRTTSYSDINGMNAFVTESYSENFLHSARDTTGTFIGEWVTSLTGQVKYNYNTLQISYISSPVISIEDAAFGSLLSPWMGGIQTGNNTYGATVYFWGKYRMYAGSYDFGYYTDQFTVTF